MSGFYIGVDGKARKVKGGYIGVDGKARKIKKIYIGDANGKAREISLTRRLITFTLQYVSLTAEEGMTWGEWCASDYNTIGAYVQGNAIRNSSGEYNIGYQGNAVAKTTEIVSGRSYGYV